MGRTFRRLTEYMEDVDFENAMKQEKYDQYHNQMQLFFSKQKVIFLFITSTLV